MNEQDKKTIEAITEVLEDVANEPSGNAVGKIVGAGVTLIVAAGTAVVIKKRKKISEWNDKRLINKLKKRGYVVEVLDEDENCAESDVE